MVKQCCACRAVLGIGELELVPHRSDGALRCRAARECWERFKLRPDHPKLPRSWELLGLSQSGQRISAGEPGA